MKLLLQSEVAKILECSVETVKRLRTAGKIAYYRTHPILFDEVDILAFIEDKRKKAEEKAAIAARRISPEEWARLAVLKPKRAPRRPL